MIAISAFALVDLLVLWAAFGQSQYEALWLELTHLGLTFAALWIVRAQLFGVNGWESLGLPLGAAFGPCAMVILYVLQPWSMMERQTGRLAISGPMRLRLGHAIPATPMIKAARLLDERIRFATADRIEPLETILRHGSIVARRKALEAAVRSFEPRLSTLVSVALTDEDQTIRALAGAAAAQVSNNLIHHLNELETQASENPDDLYALAMVQFEHARHNVLLPQSLRTQLYGRARKCLLEFDRNLPISDERHKAASDLLATLSAELLVFHVPKPRRRVHLRAVQ